MNNMKVYAHAHMHTCSSYLWFFLFLLGNWVRLFCCIGVCRSTSIGSYSSHVNQDIFIILVIILLGNWVRSLCCIGLNDRTPMQSLYHWKRTLQKCLHQEGVSLPRTACYICSNPAFFISMLGFYFLKVLSWICFSDNIQSSLIVSTSGNF